MGSKQMKTATTATESLKLLWESGFFDVWRKFKATEDHLARRGNHFTVAELGMALKRAKHLTRRGKQGSYEYIQKYPVSAIGRTSGRKKKG